MWPRKNRDLVPIFLLVYFLTFWDFAVNSFSISTASREMFLRRWRRKNQVKTRVKQPAVKPIGLTESGQLVAKRVTAFKMPRHMV